MWWTYDLINVEDKTMITKQGDQDEFQWPKADPNVYLSVTCNNISKRFWIKLASLPEKNMHLQYHSEHPSQLIRYVENDWKHVTEDPDLHHQQSETVLRCHGHMKSELKTSSRDRDRNQVTVLS